MKLDIDGEITQVTSIETDFLAITVSAQDIPNGFEIVVGDVSKSCSLYEFHYDDFILILVAKDLVTSNCTATQQLGEGSIIMGDDLGNVYSLFIGDRPLCRLERVVGSNIGDSCVTAMARMGPDSCLVGNRDGSLSLVCREKAIRDAHRGVRISSVFEPTRIGHTSVGQKFA
jgi:hypothetical protein